MIILLSLAPKALIRDFLQSIFLNTKPYFNDNIISEKLKTIF